MRHLFVAATLAVALPFAGLPDQFEKIASAAKGRVGVAAQLLESGETADLHGDEHFPMHSLAADLDGGIAAR
jgi:beta-lactamase class A